MAADKKREGKRAEREQEEAWERTEGTEGRARGSKQLQ